MDFASGRVVDFSFSALLHEEDISSNHVANIGEVAQRSQISGFQNRRPAVAFDIGDLFGEMGNRKLRRLSRTDVVEWPNPNDVEAGEARILVTD